jgi:dolichol-phosphate mannosyltransferase
VVSYRESVILRRAAIGLPEPWVSSDVAVVLPTYQEAANLPVIVAALFDLPLPRLHVIVVDDNSPDGTGEIAEELADRYGRDRLAVVHRTGKEGLGRAYVDGMSRALAAGAEFVVQMDSDLSHRPEYLPQMLGTLLSADAEVVIGSRYIAGASVGTEWPWHRRSLSAFANAYVRFLLRLRIRDATAGYKIWRASALDAIGLQSVRSTGYSFQVEMNYRAASHGLRVLELPIHFADRAAGESKMNLRVQLESVAMPFKLKRYLREGKPGGAGPLPGQSLPRRRAELAERRERAMSPEQDKDGGRHQAGQRSRIPGSPGDGLLRRHGARFASFSVIGGGLFVAGLLFQAGLTSGLHVPSLASYIIQTVLSVQASYFLNRWFTWKTAQVPLWSSFFRYNLQKVVTVLANLALYDLLLRLGVQYLLDNVLLTIAFTFVNYVGADKLVFLHRGKQEVTVATSPLPVITGPASVGLALDPDRRD